MPEIGKAWVTINARLAPLRKALKRALNFTAQQVKRMAVIASAAFATVAVASLKWASDLEEAIDKFKVALGELAGPALAWVDQYSAAIGFGKKEMIDFISAFQLMFEGLKIGSQEALVMSASLTKLAFGFASLNNLEIEEAFIKLQAGLAGEIEPLRRFGVNLSVATMEAFALEKGITTLWKDMTEAEKVTTRYQFIMEKLNVAMNNEVDTATSLANRWKAFKGTIRETGAAIGSVFITDVAGGLGNLSKMLVAFRPQMVAWLEEMRQKVIDWWTAIGGIPGIVSKLKEAWAKFKEWYTTNMKPIVDDLIVFAKAMASVQRSMASTALSVGRVKTEPGKLALEYSQGKGLGKYILPTTPYSNVMRALMNTQEFRKIGAE